MSKWRVLLIMIHNFSELGSLVNNAKVRSPLKFLLIRYFNFVKVGLLLLPKLSETDVNVMRPLRTYVDMFLYWFRLTISIRICIWFLYLVHFLNLVRNQFTKTFEHLLSICNTSWNLSFDFTLNSQYLVVVLICLVG